MLPCSWLAGIVRDKGDILGVILVRQRLIRIGIWVVVVLAFIAWAISLAIQAPWTPWFTIGLWSVIGIGLVVRAVRGSKRMQEPLDAFHDMNQIYLGRTQTPRVDGTSPKSVEIGHPFPSDELPSRRENELGGEEPPNRPAS